MASVSAVISPSYSSEKWYKSHTNAQDWTKKIIIKKKINRDYLKDYENKAKLKGVLPSLILISVCAFIPLYNHTNRDKVIWINSRIYYIFFFRSRNTHCTSLGSQVKFPVFLVKALYTPYISSTYNI